MIKGWSFAKIITLPVPDDDLVDFPVCVKIVSDADIGGECLATGYDIRFTAADGTTLLPYERESFAVASGEATGIFWVKTDVATTGTDIWCYYGNAGAADGQDAENVWDANFAAVYHMKDATTSTILDSTANNNDGAKQAANHPIEAAGKIAKGQDFDGTDDEIDCTFQPLTNFSDFNFSFWICPALAVFQWILYCNWGANGSYAVFDGGDGQCYFYIKNDAGASVGISVPIDPDSWQRMVFTWDGVNLRSYKNGTPGAYTPQDGTCAAATVPRMGIIFDGIFDETSFSSIARSAAWIAYEYANMNPADGGLTWGAEENVKSAVHSFFES
jgi:hypothetical protein